MKKLVMIFCCTIIVSNYAVADERYAHEYYSDSNEERHRDDDRDDNRRNRNREEIYESESRYKRSVQMPRYQQNYSQQPPIQIYMQPPQQHFRQHDKQYREDRRWRERREELERMPQTPYFENQFNRDDTHW